MKRFTSALVMIVTLCIATAHAQIATTAVKGSRNVGDLLGIPSTPSRKCGTSDLIFAYVHWNQLAPLTKASIQKILSRPITQKSRLTRSGRFRIHYDTTGTDAPALITSGAIPQRIPGSVERYIDSVEATFEYVWALEVDTVGFVRPPEDGVQGGGKEYDIYVMEKGVNEFGATKWDPNAVDDIIVKTGVRGTFRSYIEIDNDFLGFRTSGMEGLRITAAHEFHHAIQVGNYGYWFTVPDNDFYFYELTSVWLERVAYAGSKDYLYDLPNYLQRFRDSQNRSLSFTLKTIDFPGYERSIWAQYLAKRFGRAIMPRIWSGVTTDPVLVSTTKVLQQLGTSLETEFAQFSFWNYFTADRVVPGKYYDEGRDWPRFLPNVTSTFGGLSSSVSSSAWPLSTQFYQFAVPGDTVTAILANVNTASAEDPSPPITTFQLQLSASNAPGPSQKVAGGLSLSFLPSDKSQWRTLYLQSTTKSIAAIVGEPFPNPVRLSRDTRLSLPLVGTIEKKGTVYVLNGALELVMSREYDVVESFGGKFLYVPVSDLRGSVPSGVCFVKASCGDKEFQWKVVVIQ